MDRLPESAWPHLRMAAAGRLQTLGLLRGELGEADYSPLGACSVGTLERLEKVPAGTDSDPDPNWSPLDPRPWRSMCWDPSAGPGKTAKRTCASASQRPPLETPDPIEISGELGGSERSAPPLLTPPVAAAAPPAATLSQRAEAALNQGRR